MPFTGIISSDVEFIPVNHGSAKIQDYRGHEEDVHKSTEAVDSSAGDGSLINKASRPDARLPQQPNMAQGKRG